jgi:hypothetical protein
MTKRYYGMPPKKLARKYRALRAASRIAHGDSLDDTELGLAFYDQSHLTREIKQFTGLTPGQLRAGKSELTQATMMGRSALGGKVSPSDFGQLAGVSLSRRAPPSCAFRRRKFSPQCLGQTLLARLAIGLCHKTPMPKEQITRKRLDKRRAATHRAASSGAAVAQW